MLNNDTLACEAVQEMIDAFPDGAMDDQRQPAFQAHVEQCPQCSRELQYARAVHEALVELPQIDCEERVLEPVHRLTDTGRPHGHGTFRGRLGRMWTMPAVARYGLVAVTVAVIAVVLAPALYDRSAGPQTSEQPNVAAQYSEEDVVQALEELNLAIDYLNEVTRRTEAMVGGRFLITPLQETLNASFSRVRSGRQDWVQDDPI